MLTLDATCAPANIRYPQDISLLNEAREKLETMIYRFCKCYGLKLPRRYRKCARKEYLAFAKSRKRTAKKIRSALRRQLGYVKRDLGYLEQFMSDGYAMTVRISVCILPSSGCMNSNSICMITESIL